jgi:hypothetical protein
VVRREEDWGELIQRPRGNFGESGPS